MAARKRNNAPEMPHFEPPCVNCGEPAIIWIRGGNVCQTHYLEIFQKEAARHAKEHGLETREDHIQYVNKLKAQPKNPRAWTLNPKSAKAAEMARELNDYTMALQPAPREPGED